MAEEEKNTPPDPEKDDLQQDETNPENGKKGSKTGKIFLFAGVICLQIVLSFFIIRNFYPSVHKTMSSLAESEPVYYQIEEIIINPANTDGARYLLLSIAMELENAGVSAELEKKRAIIIDDINTMLSQYTTDEFNNIEKREIIKKELAVMINQTLEKNSVQNLFFTKYVMQ